MSRILKTVLDEGNPNKIADAARDVKLGQVAGAIHRVKVPVAAHIAVLPDEAKAAALLGGFITVGTVTGPIIPVVAAPASTREAQINLDGNVLFLAADAVTEAELWYVGFDGRVIVATLPVVANVATLTPPGQLLISVDELVGGAVAAKNARGTAQAADTDVQLSADGDSVIFGSSSTVTQARFTYIALDQPVTDRLTGLVDY